MQTICLKVAGSLLIAITLQGCASNIARIDQFDQFAQAGHIYSAGFNEAVDESFDVMVENDSLLLLRARNFNSDEDFRREALMQYNEQALERMSINRDLAAHIGYLDSYFKSLGVLTSRKDDGELGKLSTGIAGSLKNATTALGALNSRIADAKIGEQPIATFLDANTPRIVAIYQRAQLDRILRDTGPTVARAIDTQIAALEAMKKQVIADRQDLIDDEWARTVEKPYVASGRLSSDWGSKRIMLLRQRAKAGKVDAALKAARKLKIAYIALLENRAENGSFELLVQDIAQIVTFAEELTIPNLAADAN